ncbi:RNA polymerase sigma factor [Acetobacter papayae]|uniref:RNA polymerase sigma factor n=1 Tax=Acetobacter papayae TaxID=1076592 RepID=UPI000B154B7B|nr:RNA polymerase sigma factor [Acetobacter papayae]
MPPLPARQQRQKHADVFERRYGHLLSYASKLTGDRAEAEDLVQEAWCLTDGSPPESVASPFHYLRAVIRNLFVSNIRRRRRQAESTLNTDGFEQRLPADQPSPEEVVMARLEMEHLERLINAMPPRQATAVRMYHFENRKLKDIAAHLDISVSFAQALIASGLADCAEDLDRACPR